MMIRTQSQAVIHSARYNLGIVTLLNASAMALYVSSTASKVAFHMGEGLEFQFGYTGHDVIFVTHKVDKAMVTNEIPS
jgi:hypothetical protein